jgi:glycosyltransferase involved in cell wall biosynthesis
MKISLFTPTGHPKQTEQVVTESTAQRILISCVPDPLTHPTFPQILAQLKHKHITLRSQLLNKNHRLETALQMGVDEIILPIEGLSKPLVGGWKNLLALITTANTLSLPINIEIPIKSEKQLQIRNASAFLNTVRCKVLLGPSQELTPKYLAYCSEYIAIFWKMGINATPIGFVDATLDIPTDCKPVLPISLPSVMKENNISLLFNQGFQLNIRAQLSNQTPQQIHQLSLLAAASGNPVITQPICAGGSSNPTENGANCCNSRVQCSGPTREYPTCTPPIHWQGCSDSTVLIYNDLADKLLVQRTLPALERKLISKDVTVNPIHVNDRNSIITTDLSAAAQIIAVEFTNLPPLLKNQSIRKDARIILCDFHLMLGLDRYTPLFTNTHVTPDQVIIHSCFPRFAHLYYNAGIPLKNIHWRPYPLAKKIEPFPKYVHKLKGSNFIQRMSPAPFILAGGGHIRDIETLEKSLQQLPKNFSIPFVIFGPIAPKLSHHVPVFYKDFLSIDEYLQSAQHSIFSVIPLKETPSKAAGISLMSASLINGRPVISTATSSALDHLQDGVDSILIQQESTKQLTQAINHLVNEKTFRSHLSSGAKQNAPQISVKSWASEIVIGCPSRRIKNRDTWKSW